MCPQRSLCCLWKLYKSPKWHKTGTKTVQKKQGLGNTIHTRSNPKRGRPHCKYVCFIPQTLHRQDSHTTQRTQRGSKRFFIGTSQTLTLGSRILKEVTERAEVAGGWEIHEVRAVSRRMRKAWGSSAGAPSCGRVCCWLARPEKRGGAGSGCKGEQTK